jgi:hypothetical protein
MPPIPATNNYSVGPATRPASSIDPNAANAPLTMTYHGFSIQVNGVTIGRFTDWTPVPLDRDMTHQYELNAKTWGQPVDLVPGKANTFTLAYGRAEVWNEEVEVALGEDDVYTLLTNQNAPFAIDEVYLRGTTLYRQFRYLGCWFSSKSTDAYSGEGTGVIQISGDITFVNRIRLV